MWFELLRGNLVVLRWPEGGEENFKFWSFWLEKEGLGGSSWSRNSARSLPMARFCCWKKRENLYLMGMWISLPESIIRPCFFRAIYWLWVQLRFLRNRKQVGTDFTLVRLFFSAEFYYV